MKYYILHDLYYNIAKKPQLNAFLCNDSLSNYLKINNPKLLEVNINAMYRRPADFATTPFAYHTRRTVVSEGGYYKTKEKDWDWASRGFIQKGSSIVERANYFNLLMEGYGTATPNFGFVRPKLVVDERITNSTWLTKNYYPKPEQIDLETKDKNSWTLLVERLTGWTDDEFLGYLSNDQFWALYGNLITDNRELTSMGYTYSIESILRALAKEINVVLNKPENWKQNKAKMQNLFMQLEDKMYEILFLHSEHRGRCILSPTGQVVSIGIDIITKEKGLKILSYLKELKFPTNTGIKEGLVGLRDWQLISLKNLNNKTSITLSETIQLDKTLWKVLEEEIKAFFDLDEYFAKVLQNLGLFRSKTHSLDNILSILKTDY